MTEAYAKAAGELLGLAGTSDAIDAFVALLAAEHGTVVTSDPDDIRLLLNASSSSARIIDV
jgi:hypothetical protein